MAAEGQIDCDLAVYASPTLRTLCEGWGTHKIGSPVF
jgi:hypothetical protein